MINVIRTITHMLQWLINSSFFTHSNYCLLSYLYKGFVVSSIIFEKNKTTVVCRLVEINTCDDFDSILTLFTTINVYSEVSTCIHARVWIKHDVIIIEETVLQLGCLVNISCIWNKRCCGSFFLKQNYFEYSFSIIYR